MNSLNNIFDSAYEALNPEQKKAVDHIDGPLMVLAGPGTGKTQIIALRIARLLQVTQMDPHNILCLTFTESGVVSMRKRLLQIIGTAAYYVRIHTFHSFCNDVIKEHPEAFLFARELEPLTDIERILLFQELLADFPEGSPLRPFGDPFFYRGDIIKCIQDLKRENVSPEKLQNILSEIESFLMTHSEKVAAFTEIHGRSLKEEDIVSLQNQISNSPLSPLFNHFFANAPEDEKERKKARTQLKNAIKKAHQSLIKNLPKQKDLVLIYASYLEKLKAKGRYDYEDMILFVVEKFKTDKTLLMEYEEQFQYILVDEYQDTNGAQNELISLLGSYFESPNLFVVGDDKQSIYRFQGASLENILSFYKQFTAHIQWVALKQNYRSGQNILDASHSLIKNNSQGIANFIPGVETKLNAALQRDPIKVQIAEFSSPQTENYYLATRIKNLIEEGSKPSEIAILYRSHHDATDIMDLFLRLGVPFRLEAGEDILKDTQLNKLLSLFTYLNNPKNENQLFHLLNFDFLGFNNLDVLKLTHGASKRRTTLLELLMNQNAMEEMGLKYASALHSFTENLAQWQMLSHNLTFSEFFDRILKESGYLDFILASEEKIEHLNRLNTLFDEVKNLNRTRPDLNLPQFIEYIDLHRENGIAMKAQELQTKKEAVRLMTAHKSKGLEFEHVFIVKCVDKHWGNKRVNNRLKLPEGLLTNDLNSTLKERNEDERRLFYVAMTRAKNSSTLTYSSKNIRGRDQVPSIFIQELSHESIQLLDTKPYEDEALERLETVFVQATQKDTSKEEKDFVRGLLENYKMSITHLNNYLRCPRLFYYRNLLRVPGAKSKHASFGSAIHEALHRFTLEQKKDSENPKEALLKEFERQLKREVLSSQEFKGGLEFGKETLAGYFDTYKNDFQKNILSEYDFSSHGVHVNDIPITGKLDKIEVLDEKEKTVHVVDYKTGNPDSKSKELSETGEYFRQIVFYKLLCDLSPKFPFKFVSGEIDFVQKSRREDRFKKVKFTVSNENIEQLKTTLKSVYDDIKNLAFLSQDEWDHCGECEYCLLAGDLNKISL